MAIHGWGTPLWSSEIVAEFGDPNPGGVKWLSNFYRGGSYVSDTTNNANISTAGYIAHSMFYGASNIEPHINKIAIFADITSGISGTIDIDWKTGIRTFTSNIGTSYFDGNDDIGYFYGSEGGLTQVGISDHSLSNNDLKIPNIENYPYAIMIINAYGYQISCSAIGSGYGSSPVGHQLPYTFAGDNYKSSVSVYSEIRYGAESGGPESFSLSVVLHASISPFN